MKKEKVMVEIVAECTAHGRFQVTRKPNKRPDNGSGRVNNGLYDAVKCPVCPWWGKIIEQKLVTVGGEPEADTQGYCCETGADERHRAVHGGQPELLPAALREDHGRAVPVQPGPGALLMRAVQ